MRSADYVQESNSRVTLLKNTLSPYTSKCGAHLAGNVVRLVAQQTSLRYVVPR